MMNQNILINSSLSNSDITAKVNLTMKLEEGQKYAKQGVKKFLSPAEAETEKERTARLNAAKNLTEESTYENLKAAVFSTYMKVAIDGKLTGETKPIRTPRAEQLMRSEVKVLITGTSGEMEISVYENGFFIAKDTSDPEHHMTVGSVERVISRIGADRGGKEDLDKAMKLPWTLILSIDAQARLDHNEENREADKTDLAIRGDGSDTVGGMKVDDHITEMIAKEKEQKFRRMKEAMLNKLPGALDALKKHSDKQWFAVKNRIYTEKPVKLKDIAKDLGVSEARVTILTNKGVAFLQNHMGADAELMALMAQFED